MHPGDPGEPGEPGYWLTWAGGPKRFPGECVTTTMTGWWLNKPLWKIWGRQLGWLFPIYEKVKNVPNHQPVIHFVSLDPTMCEAHSTMLQLFFYQNCCPETHPEPAVHAPGKTGNGHVSSKLEMTIERQETDMPPCPLAGSLFKFFRIETSNTTSNLQNPSQHHI